MALTFATPAARTQTRTKAPSQGAASKTVAPTRSSSAGASLTNSVPRFLAAPQAFTSPASPSLSSHKSAVAPSVQTVNQPNDHWEKEARHLSDTAAKSSSGSVLKTTSLPSPRRAAPTAPSDRQVPFFSALPGIASTGTPLPQTLRENLEATTGVGLGSVRVHHTPEAQRAAVQLQAKAFTRGSHIYLHPASNPTDHRLLAHETAHTIQQSASLRSTHSPFNPTTAARGPPVRSKVRNAPVLQPTAIPDSPQSAPRFSPAPQGLVQRDPLDLLLPAAQIAGFAMFPGAGPPHLLFRSFLSNRLNDILRHVSPKGYFNTLSDTIDLSAETLLNRFPLQPAHFSWPLTWLRNSSPLLTSSAYAQDLLSGAPENEFAASFRHLSALLSGLFTGNWKWLAESLTATRLSYAQIKERLGDSFSALASTIGLGHLGEDLDLLAHELLANAAVIDNSPLLLDSIADDIGYPHVPTSTQDLVTWAAFMRDSFKAPLGRLKTIAATIAANLELVEPLKQLHTLAPATATLRSYLEEAAFALDDPDNVPDDARLFKVLLPGITTHLRLLGLALDDALIWPSMLTLSFLQGARDWAGFLRNANYPLHDWIETTAREIFQWVDDVFVAGFSALAEIITDSSSWLSLLEGLFTAMAPAMADENTKEIKPSLLIRALKKLGVPVELLDQIQAHIKSLGKVLKHPFKFFRNLTSAITNGLKNFAQNIGHHLFQTLAAWILGDLPITLPSKFDLPSIFASLASLLGLTLDHVLDVLERKHPGVGNKVRRALAAGTLALKWIRLLYEKRYAELWDELKTELSLFWNRIVEQVQQTLITTLIEGGVSLLLNFLTPGLRQAVTIIKKIYQIIKNLKAQATRMFNVLNAIFQAIGDIAEGKLDGAIKFVEDTAVKVLKVAIHFFADWLGLGDIPAKIRSALDTVRGYVDLAIGKFIDLARRFWEMLAEAVASVLDWWKNKTIFQNESGETHTLYFDEKKPNPPLTIATTPKVLEEYLATYVPGTDAEKNAITQIKTHATKINNLKAKTDGSFGKTDGEEIRKHFHAIAGLLAKLGKAETVPPTKVTWKTMSGKYNDGIDMEADPLSLDPGGFTGSQPYASSALWLAVNRRSMTYIRGHLLNHHVHGPGSITNLIPITRSCNTRMETIAESYIKAAVISQKRVLHYRVYAIFPTNKPKRKHIPEEAELPEAIQILAFYQKRKGNGWEIDSSAVPPIPAEKVPSILPADTAP